jgi:transcriptional regulator with XRE-family HTH domain
MAIRTLRIRRSWRQTDLASAADVSRALISLIERGHSDRVALSTIRRVAMALEARAEIALRWRGGELDRLLDAGHAALVEAVIRQLQRAGGWVVAPEASFSIFGERGSIDVLAWYERRRLLMVIEVKTELSDIQDLLMSSIANVASHRESARIATGTPPP